MFGTFFSHIPTSPVEYLHVMNQPTIVNSWNEWDPLRHVIVGVADKGCIPVSEPAIEYHFPPEGGVQGMRGQWPDELIARAEAAGLNVVVACSIVDLGLNPHAM